MSRRTTWLLAIAFCATVWWMALSAAFAEPFTCRVERVLDGDTIACQTGGHIRLAGIDAPEGRQKGGEASHRALEQFLGLDTGQNQSRPAVKKTWLAGPLLVCDKIATDRYRRTVAFCEHRGLDIGAWMVRNGWAWDYAAYSRGLYAGEQGMARADRRGIWAEPNPQPPWEWRKEQEHRR